LKAVQVLVDRLIGVNADSTPFVMDTPAQGD